MNKILLSIALTLFFGPGAGHLYLRKIREGILLFLATLACTVVFALNVTLSIPADRLPAISRQATVSAIAKEMTRSMSENESVFRDALRDYTQDHPDAMLVFDTVLAAIWSYALVSAFGYARKMLPPRPQGEAEREEE